jgi:hypothetical protein
MSIQRAREAELQRELEIVNFTVPINELVVREFSAGGDFAGDRAVFDAPRLRISLPTVQRPAVEYRFEGRRVGAQCGEAHDEDSWKKETDHENGTSEG